MPAGRVDGRRTPLSMSISQNAVSAREAARSKTGEFGHQHHTESGVSLDAPPAWDPPAHEVYAEGFESEAFLNAAAMYQESNQLKKFTDIIRDLHPEATTFQADHDYSRSWIEAKDGAGNEVEVDDVLYDIHPYKNRALWEAWDADHWVSMDEVEQKHREHEEKYKHAQAGVMEALEHQRAARQYAQELTWEILVQHRLIHAAHDGEDDYDHLDATEYVGQIERDELEDTVTNIARALNGATSGDDVDTDTLVRELDTYQPDYRGWSQAVDSAVSRVRSAQSRNDGGMEVARGAYVNTYLSEIDGTPVVDVMTDGGGFSGPIRVHVNEGAVFDQDPEQR